MRTFILQSGTIWKENGGPDVYKKYIESASDFYQRKAIDYNPIDGENRIMAAYEMFIAKGSE